MAEQIFFYREEYTGATPLAPALRHIGLQGLRTSEINHLYTAGLGGPNDKFATGIGGRIPDDRNLTWSIRWDWDQDKGEHVNVVLLSPQRGTEKYVYLSRGRNHKGTSDAAYFPTLERFTSDCRWSKEVVDKLAADRRASYRLECAENGRKRWCYVSETING
ncbi:MAG: hypothetical protein MMC33_000399 [Icmadophila ericetorum]|nr:hypothetical protein [Icmadophila ericetorum]